jgi:poly(3-hydroxybutyrate) depolymerase
MTSRRFRWAWVPLGASAVIGLALVAHNRWAHGRGQATDAAAEVPLPGGVVVEVEGESGPASGCGHVDGPTRSFHLRAPDGRGTMRDSAVLVPKAIDARAPLSVVFVYHGSGGSEAGAMTFGLQEVAGAASSSIFVFPQGMPYATFGVGWDDSCGGYDVPLFDRTLDYLERHYCIDPSRVFAAGFSWGCDFATALLCCRGHRIRAIAAASCTDEFRDPAHFETYQNLPCPDLRPGGVRFTHDAKGDEGYPEPDFISTSALYRSFDACPGPSQAIQPEPCVAYRGCAAPFIECAYDRLGHTIPRGWAADSSAFFATFH